MELAGVYTALITPFAEGELDLEALSILVHGQIDSGVNGLVPLGSTGEALTLSFDERAAVIRTVVDGAKGRVPVIVGAGSGSTAGAIELVAQAKELGADAALVVTPPYIKATADGLVAHYSAIADEVDLPMVVYNVPGRTGTNITAELALRLSELPFLIGIKEASGDMSQMLEIAWSTRDNWSVLCGEDLLFYSYLASGAHGHISVTSNIVPARFAKLYKLWQAGDAAGSLAEMSALQELIQAMFCTSNPIPIKAACGLIDICDNELRLPLQPLNEDLVPVVSRAMKNFGIL